MADQLLKPVTAAKKLGVYLPATPADFRETELTRTQFLALQENPPEWLAELRRSGPHPRPVVAQKLGISTSGLARAGVDDVMTTEQIKELLTTMPEWLVTERSRQAAVHEENARIKSERKAKAELRGE
jgi:hypothetical protein